MKKDQNLLVKRAAFEYIVSRLQSWQKEVNDKEPLTKVKALKLLFFIAAIKPDGDDLLDVFNHFVAMQHGPVEYDVYKDMIQNNFETVSFTSTMVESKKNYSESPYLSSELIKRIDNSIAALRHKNEYLVKRPAFDLAAITHKWDCWSTSYQLALFMGVGQFEITKKQIRNSNCIFE